VIILKTRFCLECKNFEDRNEIDGVVLCARGHEPEIACPDFQDRYEELRKTASKTRFCYECKNFEDRIEIDGNVVCDREHEPGISCPDFQDRRVDVFYSYIYWAYLYSTGKTIEGKDYYEKRFSRKLSNQELAYACLLDYFELGLEDSHLYRCWETVRKTYEEKLPIISKIFAVTLQGFNLYGGRVDLEKVFLDLLSSKKGSEEIGKEILEGHYSRGVRVMENEIVYKEVLALEVKLIKVRAPLIARKAKSGQFVILRVYEDSERIPLTLIDWTPNEGTITLVFKEVGASTKELGTLEVGDRVHDLVGPLGNPGEIKFCGKVCVIGRGVAIAAAYERAKKLKEAGNNLTTIISARTSKLLIYKEELRRLSDKLYIVTDDGSEGIKGYANDVLKSLLGSGERFDLVYAVGAATLMRTVSEVTKPYNIKTTVSLNALMVDGTGMCGCCRVTVGGKTMFTCVDGPEFDAHLVDFEEFRARIHTYDQEEKNILKLYGEKVSCKG